MASIYDDLYKKVAALPSDTRIYNCVDLRSRMFNPIKGDVEGFITHTLSNTQAIPDFLSSGNKRRASTSNIDTTPMFIGGPGGPPQRKKRRVNVAHTSPASNYGYSSSSASNYMAPSFANTNQNSPLDSANYRALRPLNTNTNTNNKNTQAMTYQVHAPASVRQETVVPKEDLVLDGILQNVANYGDFVEMKWGSTLRVIFIAYLQKRNYVWITKREGKALMDELGMTYSDSNVFSFHSDPKRNKFHGIVTGPSTNGSKGYRVVPAYMPTFDKIIEAIPEPHKARM
eukprot:50553_1